MGVVLDTGGTLNKGVRLMTKLAPATRRIAAITTQQPGAPTLEAPTRGKGKRFAVVGLLLVVIAGLAAAAGLLTANRDSDTASDDALSRRDSTNLCVTAGMLT